MPTETITAGLPRLEEGTGAEEGGSDGTGGGASVNGMQIVCRVGEETVKPIRMTEVEKDEEEREGCEQAGVLAVFGGRDWWLGGREGSEGALLRV